MNTKQTLWIFFGTFRNIKPKSSERLFGLLLRDIHDHYWYQRNLTVTFQRYVLHRDYSRCTSING